MIMMKKKWQTMNKKAMSMQIMRTFNYFNCKDMRKVLTRYIKKILYLAV
jgi:hypothetical protein